MLEWIEVFISTANGILFSKYTVFALLFTGVLFTLWSGFGQYRALTHGVARQINRLCDLSLLIGFAEERQTITAAHFESVCQELVAVVPE